jgi:alanine dehydrogenase
MQNKTRKTAVLTNKDIVKLVNIRQAIDIARKVFAAHGLSAVRMPPKIYLHLDKYYGDFRAMPAYVEGMEACGVKWVNVHPNNRTRGLPTVMAMIVLSDPRTGYTLAVMDGTYITNLRTGAAGGIAAKYLANKSSSQIGFVGCGVQASFQLMALSSLFTIKAVDAYDKEPARAKQFVQQAANLGIAAQVCNSIKTCVRNKDIVVTTTPSRKPIIRAAWIRPGTHINAIGADAKGKEELDPLLLKKARIIVDDIAQAVHSGEINVSLSKKLFKIGDISATLGQVIVGTGKGRVSPKDITIFDSTGLAIQDMALASYVYKRAIARRGAIRTISFL